MKRLYFSICIQKIFESAAVVDIVEWEEDGICCKIHESIRYSNSIYFLAKKNSLRFKLTFWNRLIERNGYLDV
jgi:hypothetical protein